MIKSVATRVTLVALAAFMAVSVSGCGFLGSLGPAQDNPPDETSATTETHDEGAKTQEFTELDYLNGSWDVATKLTDIDNTAMTPAADKPGAEWDCNVEGGTMTLLADKHKYSGVLKALGDKRWAYEATATYDDDEGATWTSTIRVDATQQDDDSFSGSMQGTIASDKDGPLYTAEWDISGTRR